VSDIQVSANRPYRLAFDEHVALDEFSEQRVRAQRPRLHRHHVSVADDIASARPARLRRRVDRVALRLGSRPEQADSPRREACRRRALQEIAPRSRRELRLTAIAQYAHDVLPSCHLASPSLSLPVRPPVLETSAPRMSVGNISTLRRLPCQACARPPSTKS